MKTEHYTITLDHDRKIVRVNVLSDVDKVLGPQIITQARTYAVQHEADLLYDVRGVRITASLSEAFFLPRKLDILQTPEARVTRVALLTTSGNDNQKYAFYETVTHNMGLPVRVFFEEDAALAWLSEKT